MLEAKGRLSNKKVWQNRVEGQWGKITTESFMTILPIWDIKLEDF